MDKNKCPKTKIQKNFPQKYSLLYNKLKLLLKGGTILSKTQYNLEAELGRILLLTIDFICLAYKLWL